MLSKNPHPTSTGGREGFSLKLDEIYGALPPAFYTKMPAEGFAKSPRLVAFNPAVARLIDLPPDAESNPDAVQYFSGNKTLPGAHPLAMVYAGHQFGVWVPRLGDGRALLIAQIKNKDNQRFDIQLKGSGKTPYSRFADGRAVLRSTIREYLGSEMMAGLQIATSRALCMIETGEQVRRERWEPGAILTRLATSHIRFGHVEYFCHSEQTPMVKVLLDHVLDYYLPQFKNNKQPYHQILSWVVDKTALLLAQWQAVGFCHGVMNTDNMSLLGETLDYGPFGFLEEYNPHHVCNHSDEQGRYSFANQPRIAWWNLYALAMAMKSLVSEEDAEALVKPFGTQFENYFYDIMSQKLGLDKKTTSDQSSTHQIIHDWLALLEKTKSDYTLSFVMLGGDMKDVEKNNLFLSNEGKVFLQDYKKILGDKPDAARRAQMAKHNPLFILRNWVAQVAIEKANQGDYKTLNELLQVCQQPFEASGQFSFQKNDQGQPIKMIAGHNICAAAPADYQHLSVSCSS